MPFRGHRQDISEDEGNKGNFLSLAELISKYDESLSAHITSVLPEKNERENSRLAEEFCAAHELEERDFAKRRVRKKKKILGELCNDDLEENVKSRYRKETFIFAIDTAVSSIRRRFTTHKEILADFALLDPERFADISSEDLPPNSFKNVAKKLWFG